MSMKIDDVNGASRQLTRSKKNELKVSQAVDIGPTIIIDQRSGAHSKDSRKPMVAKGSRRNTKISRQGIKYLIFGHDGRWIKFETLT